MSSSSPPPRFLRTALWGMLVLVILAVSVTALMSRTWLKESLRGSQALPVLGSVPNFELVNRDGRPISRDDLEGKPWVADFIFTSCKVSCPVMTTRMADLSQKLATDRLRWVSISVDPDNDTPEVLAAYAKKFDAADSWLFLTGKTEEIYPLVRDGFRLGVAVADPSEPGSALEPISHSTRFVLVDSESQIRGYYDAFDPASLNRLAADLGRLVPRR
ncbi:MAG: SCO family protein [Deltaproteobacteria bacterium]|nr:SCO family protein [Deltaproteobacteria bacterium]